MGGVPVQVTRPAPLTLPVAAHRGDDEPDARFCPARQADLLELQAHGGTFRSGYRHILGGDSPWCAPGDREKAAQFLARIEAAQARGGWSGAERTRLSRLHAKWAKRASGQDARFMVMGTRAGRMADHEQREMQRWQGMARLAQQTAGPRRPR